MRLGICQQFHLPNLTLSRKQNRERHLRRYHASDMLSDPVLQSFC